MVKSKVSPYHKCLGRKLKGRKFRNKTTAKKALKAAIKTCKRTHGAKKTVRRKTKSPYMRKKVHGRRKR